MVNMLQRMFKCLQKERDWTEAAWIIRSWQLWAPKAAASYCCTLSLLLGCEDPGFEAMSKNLVVLPGGLSDKSCLATKAHVRRCVKFYAAVVAGVSSLPSALTAA